MCANRILFAIDEQGFELLIGLGSVLRGRTNNDEIQERVYSYLVVREEWKCRLALDGVGENRFRHSSMGKAATWLKDYLHVGCW